MHRAPPALRTVILGQLCRFSFIVFLFFIVGLPLYLPIGWLRLSLLTNVASIGVPLVVGVSRVGSLDMFYRY